MTQSFVIDRSGLSLSDLTIDVSGLNDYVISKDGWGEPPYVPRTTFESSTFVNGQLLVASVDDLTAWALGVFINGTDGADLASKIAALAAAIKQFAYTVTATMDDSGTTWNAFPGSMSRDQGIVAPTLQWRYSAFYRLTIPVNPV